MAFGLAIIRGNSMIPTYAPGEVVLVHYGHEVSQNDVVLVDFHKRTDIKRIKTIKENMVFVMGDNDAVSIDSRHYGSVPMERILGKVIYRFPAWLRIGGKN